MTLRQFITDLFGFAAFSAFCIAGSVWLHQWMGG